MRQFAVQIKLPDFGGNTINNEQLLQASALRYGQIATRKEIKEVPIKVSETYKIALMHGDKVRKIENT